MWFLIGGLGFVAGLIAGLVWASNTDCDCEECKVCKEREEKEQADIAKKKEKLKRSGGNLSLSKSCDKCPRCETGTLVYSHNNRPGSRIDFFWCVSCNDDTCATRATFVKDK